MKCGLLGRTLSHSYSPQIHAMLGDYSYELFEKEPEELSGFLKNGDWDGINVTVPYKKEVIPHLDELTAVAKRLGAVNTIVRKDGRLIGHNTDYFGFLEMVKTSSIAVSGKKALVLGSGGASATAVAVLEDLGALVTVISRAGEQNYGNLHLHRDASLLINTTPVGMYPDNGNSLVDLEQLPRLEAVLDVIYNPSRTKLLLDAQERGITAVNGLLMLVAQAKEAAQWFTGKKVEDGLIRSIHDILRSRMENIILIGMPGCGKSTVGQQLADRLERPFSDSDALVEEISGMSIPNIFEKQDESAFRACETEALFTLGKQSGLVIATGGGCVTQPGNRPLLRQNGTVIWLHRDISKLPTEGRPLSQQGALEKMYEIRMPMYKAFADHIIDNNGSAEETVAKILEVLQ